MQPRALESLLTTEDIYRMVGLIREKQQAVN